MNDFRIRNLRRDDLDFAQRVREAAGWNQTRADWVRLLNHQPDGSFLCEVEGRPAGTATTTQHRDEVGWIGMVLVDPDFRRRGVATQLLENCISYLNPIVRNIKLDATPAGLEVYTKLGFVEEWRLHRWHCEELKKPGVDSAGFQHESDWPESLDRKAFGADRTEFLKRLARDSKIHVAGDGGFGMIRPGAKAHYLGPVVADSPEAGQALISSLLPQDGPVFWDIPDDNLEAVEFASDLGFTRERPLIRMRLGPLGEPDDPSLQWAIGGPETG